jgi:hypothetical protein
MDHLYEIQIAQTEGGCGVVFIFQNDNPTPIDSFQISRSGHPIILADFIDQETVIAIDKGGYCALYHRPRYKIVQTSQLATLPIESALLLKSKQQIVILIGEQFSTQKALQILDIPTFKKQQKLILPAAADLNRIWQVSEHQFAIYFQPGGSLDQEPGDGFYLADIKSQTLSSICFNYPSSCIYGPSPLDISLQHQIGVRPRFDQIKLESVNGHIHCPIRVQFFHPLKGVELGVITVRNLSSEHIFEDTNPETALANLSLPSSFEEYQETRDEVLDRITDIKICDNEPAFWIGFQHGLIRKISLDGKIKSPLLAHPGDKKHQDTPFIRTNCDNPITLSTQEEIITFGHPKVSVKLSTIDLSQNKDIVILKNTNLNHQNKTRHKILNELSWFIQAVDSIKEADQLIKGFNEIVNCLDNKQFLGDGNIFRFCFKDQNSELSEEMFFHQIKINPIIAKQYVKYINLILETKQKRYYRAEIPAGYFAIKSLVLHDIQYLLLFNQYLSSTLINISEDAELLSSLTKIIYQKYGWKKETIDLLLTNAYFQPGSGMDQFINYWQSDGFRKQIKTAGLFDYLTNHSIFQSLANEYFSAINPYEEALFSAIEKDDFKSVSDILKCKKPQIELKHPEFSCTALALAIQLENQQIIDILIEHGAEVDSLDQGDLLYIIAKKNNAFTDQERQVIKITIETLNEEKQILFEQLSKIQYDELLSIAIGKEQINQIKYLENRIQALSTEIRFAELGLDRTGTESLFDNYCAPYQKQNTSAKPYITEEVFFDEKFQKSIIVVEDLNNYLSQSEALDQLIALTKNGYQDLITSNQRLLFYFRDINQEWSEAEFYEHIKIDIVLAEKLDQFMANLIQYARSALWCDDEMQTGMYAISALTLFDKKYINRLIEYIKSNLIHHDYEKAYPSELVYDLLDEYDWCPEILKLVTIRAINHGGEFAEDEFRILLKKGGLNLYLQAAESFQLCMDLIIWESENDEQVIQKYSDLIQQYTNS